MFTLLREWSLYGLCYSRRARISMFTLSREWSLCAIRARSSMFTLSREWSLYATVEEQRTVRTVHMFTFSRE